MIAPVFYHLLKLCFLQARKKMATVLDSMRKACASPLLIEVPASVIDPVRNFIRALEGGIRHADSIISGDVTAWDMDFFEDLPLPQARQAEKLLLASLANILAARNQGPH